MEILVQRGQSKQGATIGRMSVAFPEQQAAFSSVCYTLEDEVREVPGQAVSLWKVQDKTAIPRGRYRVIITFSPHFGCDLPLLVDVPGFTSIRIHWGNKPADTDGCILVGQTTEGNLIYKSKAAFDVLFPQIQAAIAAGHDVFLTVS